MWSQQLALVRSGRCTRRFVSSWNKASGPRTSEATPLSTWIISAVKASGNRTLSDWWCGQMLFANLVRKLCCCLSMLLWKTGTCTSSCMRYVNAYARPKIPYNLSSKNEIKMSKCFSIRAITAMRVMILQIWFYLCLVVKITNYAYALWYLYWTKHFTHFSKLSIHLSNN